MTFPRSIDVGISHFWPFDRTLLPVSNDPRFLADVADRHWLVGAL